MGLVLLAVAAETSPLICRSDSFLFLCSGQLEVGHTVPEYNTGASWLACTCTSVLSSCRGCVNPQMCVREGSLPYKSISCPLARHTRCRPSQYLFHGGLASCSCLSVQAFWGGARSADPEAVRHLRLDPGTAGAQAQLSKADPRTNPLS